MSLLHLRLIAEARVEIDGIHSLLPSSAANEKFLFPLQVLYCAAPGMLPLDADKIEFVSRYYKLIQQTPPQTHAFLKLNIANALLTLKEYPCAITLLETMLSDGAHLDTESRIEVLCALARTFMIVGNVPRTQHTFSQIEKLIMDQPAISPSSHDTLMMNRAMLAIGNGDWTAASTILTTLVTASPNNLVAVNNLCVCLLYLGRLQESISMLEGLVFTSSPIVAGTSDHILFNLTTLYELGSEGGLDKKQKMTDNLVAHSGDNLQFEHFKL